MISKIRALAFSATMLVLASCASLPPQQAYNRDVNQSIKTIAILPMRETEVSLMMLNNPASSFGLIGGLIAEADRASKQKKMREGLTAAKFDHLAVFKEAFTVEMGKRGYTLIWPEPMVEATKSSRAGNSLRKSYVPVTGADAQVDLNFGFVGYGASGAGAASPYRPTAVILAQLVTADGKSKLFTETVIYHNLFNAKGGIVLPPDEKYSYSKFADLETAGGQTAEGLTIAVQSVAQKLAEQL